MKHKILNPGDLARFILSIWRKDKMINFSQAREMITIMASETVQNKKFIPGNICHSPLDWFLENAVFTVGIIKEKVFQNNVKYPLGLELAKIFREAYRYGVDLVYSLYLHGLDIHGLLNRSILLRGINNIKKKARELKKYAESLEYFLEDDDSQKWDKSSFQYW